MSLHSVQAGSNSEGAAARPAIDLSTKPWLNPAEAAEYLSLSTVKALRRRVERGTVPPWCWTKLGGSLRFSRVALDQLLSGDSSPRAVRGFKR